MHLTIFLGKIFGLFFVITSIAYLTDTKSCKKTIHKILASSEISGLLASLILIFGLIVVNLHNVWSSPIQIIVTLFGWILLVFGVFLNFFRKSMDNFTKKMQKHHGYTWISLAFLAVGIYLTYMTYFFF